ncbi:MAG: TIGR03936 family radical SAM-associated protein [Synergistaceae bacterium]|jgi:radical SAM-linked protein|nr:TIGR03936 family radical SAM-associated protein [Synergistaceae bacterium]
MPRVRLLYEKRGGACFVPHVALATVFTRAAARAGITLHLTEGFSPHPRMSFGPELPAGVVALCEPVDVRVREYPERSGDERVWNDQMPDGFRVLRSLPVAEDAPALGKVCRAAHYRIWPRNGRVEELSSRLAGHYGEDVLDLSVEDSDRGRGVSLALANPAANGIGGWVRALVASEFVAGWQDLCIVRTTLGLWEEGRVKFPGATEIYHQEGIE